MPTRNGQDIGAIRHVITSATVRGNRRECPSDREKASAGGQRYRPKFDYTVLRGFDHTDVFGEFV
jgi:hypothetical protein